MKLRVNRPRLVAACVPLSELSADHHFALGTGAVRPSQVRTVPPFSPVRAARSTHPAAAGKRSRMSATSAAASPAVPPYIAERSAILALERSPPRSGASSV